MSSALFLLALPALADTVELGGGAVLDAHILAWEPEGECRLGVEEGPLAGAIVLVPCADIVRFTRAAPEVPVLLPTMEGPVTEVPFDVAEAPAPPEVTRTPDGTEWRRVTEALAPTVDTAAPALRGPLPVEPLGP